MLVLDRVLGAVIILAVGLLLIKIILYIARKALMKSRLDGAIYTFVLNSIKIILYLILVLHDSARKVPARKGGKCRTATAPYYRRQKRR